MKWKIAFVSLIAIIVLMQFVYPKLPITASPDNMDLFVSEKVPEDIKIIISRSCYDCHSMQSKYPWHCHIAPVKWLISHDIKEGRRAVNFSAWGTFDTKDKIKKLGDLSDVIKEKEMPVPIYLIMHNEAKLSADDRDKLINWADATSESYFQ